MKPFIFKWPGNLNKVPEEILIKIQLRCAIVLLCFCQSAVNLVNDSAI